MNPLLADPWVAAEIESALAPYAGRLSEDDLAWMRAELAERLAADENAARLLSRARPRVVEQSGVVGCDVGAAPPSRDGARRGRTG